MTQALRLLWAVLFHSAVAASAVHVALAGFIPGLEGPTRAIVSTSTKALDQAGDEVHRIRGLAARLK